MEIQLSDIVRALAGRDKGKLFFVVGQKEGYALLADGKSRRAETPKRKKLKHLRLERRSDCKTAQKICSGEKVTNGELRRALAEYSQEPGEGKEGM